MEFYEFILKERPAWDIPKEVEDGKDEDDNTKWKLVFKTEPVLHDIKIQLPFAPQTYSMILKHIALNTPEEGINLVISQYMWTGAGKDEQAVALQQRILKDGRLLFSCMAALLPLFDICEHELKKN